MQPFTKGPRTRTGRSSRSFWESLHVKVVCNAFVLRCFPFRSDQDASELRRVAQSVRGAISGSVTDPSGALIPNATVTATNQGTGSKSVTHTTGAGVYRFPDLPIGTYTVTATAPGFATKTSTGVLVQVNSTTRTQHFARLRSCH